MLNIPFEKFEKNVMDKLLEDNNQANIILRQQYNNATIIREFTGSGFFSTFKIPDSIPRLTPPTTFNLSNLLCDINGISEFGGFLLYIKNGAIFCMEGYSFENEWPIKINNYRLYTNSDN